MIGGFHAKAIAAMTGGELIGAADRVLERTQAFAEQYDTTAYDSVDAMLADPQIDIVTIGTPSGAHFDPAMAAIEAGKHVVIEKPLEVTTERIDQMVAAAKAKASPSPPCSTAASTQGWMLSSKPPIQDVLVNSPPPPPM